MIPGFARRLRLTFLAPKDEAPTDAACATDPPQSGREVEFTAYAEDCRVFGRIRLDTERLTDMLNGADEYDLIDVLVESLADGHQAAAHEVILRRDELFAVHASGPRGNPGRRTRTRPFPIAVRISPYTVHGHVHALPGTDPLAALRHRKPIVPLTDAWIEYQLAGTERRQRVGTILVNRDVADWVQLSTDEELAPPDLGIQTPPDPAAKDLTGEILVWDAMGNVQA